MKIAIVATLAGPGPIAGGVWRVAESQAEALRDAGHDVKVLAGWLADPRKVQANPSLDLVRLRNPLPGNHIRFLVGHNIRSKVRGLAKWADVVHLHLCRDYVSTMSARVVKDTGTRIVAQAHGMLDRPKSKSTWIFDALVGRSTYSLPTTWLSFSPSEDASLQRLGIQTSLIERMHNAVPDPGTFWSGPSKGSHFVFASRLHPRKQPIKFVKAALEYLDGRNSDARFTLAGPDQGERQALEQLVASSPHKERFRFPGPLSQPEVATLLKTATAMVLPSLDEPYPMIAIESAALGIPMIISDQTGVSPALAQNDAAIVIPPEVSNLKDAMEFAVENPASLTALSQSARTLYLKMWTLEGLATSLDRVYRISDLSDH